MRPASPSTPATDSMATVPSTAPLFDPGIPSTSAPANAGDTGSLFAPTTPATPPPPPAVAAKTSVVLTKPIDVQTAYGKVTVRAGTVLKLVAQEGSIVRVNYANGIIAVPTASTDLGESAPGQ